MFRCPSTWLETDLAGSGSTGLVGSLIDAANIASRSVGTPDGSIGLRVLVGVLAVCKRPGHQVSAVK